MIPTCQIHLVDLTPDGQCYICRVAKPAQPQHPAQIRADRWRAEAEQSALNLERYRGLTPRCLTHMLELPCHVCEIAKREPPQFQSPPPTPLVIPKLK